jgi:hypothetical protein
MSLPTFYVPAETGDPGAIPVADIPEEHKVKMLAAGAEPPTAPLVKPVKLGRKTPKAGAKCLKLGAYINKAKAQPLPASCDHYTKAVASIKQMLGNDQEGDCVIASTGHGEGIASGNDTGTPVLSSTSEMLNEYHRVCGPGDNGCNIQDVLNEWQNNGITIGGQKRKIDGWVAIDPANRDELKTAILVFGSCRFGFNVPSDFMNTPDGGTWDISNAQIVGGHDVRGIDFDDTKGVRIATWAGTRWMTWRLLADSNLVDEAYTELMPDWSGADGVAPNGIKVDELKSDLAAWKQGTIPVWGPVSPPPPPGPPPPSPPVPPVPASFPNYVGSFKSGLWNSTYTTILTPVAAFHAPAAFGPVVPWFTVITDGFTLFRAVMSRDIAGIIAALIKLAADFGLTFAPHRVGAVEIVWADLISATRKLVADALTAWTSGLPLNTLWADLQAVFAALRS